MPTIPVSIKHAGRTHQIDLNTDAPAAAFKEEIYQVTGVPPDRMKVMIKGGMLKDDTDWRKVAPKPNQTFMVIGAAGELPKPPPKPVVFLEDMDDTELAEALSMPVGLRNLGNTCYMNATVQAMRAIPELQEALKTLRPGTGLPLHVVLTNDLRDLYDAMSKTTEGFTPFAFLQTLRQAFPQFNERSRSGSGPAQQDAEECWTQIVNALSVLPGLPGPDGASSQKKFIDQYMTGEMTSVLRCEEAPEEPETIIKEKIMKVACNISKETHYMHTGIMSSLDQTIEKNSPTLGREARYTQTSRISRLPSNLMVHMVRFHWKRDIGKKTKIMRKVKFPFELDVLDLVTDDLKRKLANANGKIKEIERDRAERRKVHKRTKIVGNAAESSKSSDPESSATNGAVEDVAMAGAQEETSQDKEREPLPGELENEDTLRERESREFEALIDPDLKADTGASVTGLFELCAIVTHKGASADAGHYIGFVKKDVFHIPKSYVEEDDQEWYQFDDEKVSIVSQEKVSTLDGGGESASAYILLYRQKRL